MNAITREEFTELIASQKLRLKRELRFVPEEIAGWEDRDFVAVTNRARSEGVIITADREYVVPFRLQARKPNASGGVEPIICDLCATWQRGSNSAIISFRKERSSQSFLCCADLDCSLHVRGKTTVSELSRTQLRENISAPRRIERLQSKFTAVIKNAA